jgi:transcriptional regulator with XRE-family HTH domain
MTHKKQIHLIDSYAGEQLRKARKSLGMSQKALASMLLQPITFQQIQKYERGSNRLAASRLWEFSQVLGLPPETFFPHIDGAPFQCSSPQEASLLQSFRNLPDSKKKALITLLNAEGQ